MDELTVSKNVHILVRQVKYLNNIVEQDHWAVKRVTKPMMYFKSFQSARAVLAGIELMHIIRKGQFTTGGFNCVPFANQFYTLAGRIPPK